MSISRCALYLAFACLLLSVPALAQSKPRIGVSLPLTGGASAEGQDLQSILTFANETLASGRYDLLFEDDKCSNKDAVTVAQKLTTVDKVSYVLGYACSGALLSSAPIFERAKVVAIGLATGAPEISAAGDYIFRTIPSLEVAAQRVAEHVRSRGIKRISVLSEETAYCRGLADAFERHNANGQFIFERVDYLPDTSDFASLLIKARSHGSDAIFLNPQDEQGMIRLYRQLLDLQWQVPVYAAYYPGFSEFRKTFGKTADGIVFADLPFIDKGLTSEGSRLYQDYVAKHGNPKSSEFYFVTALSAFTALDQAIRSGQDVHRYLYENRFSGVFGAFTFDRNGDVQGDPLTFVLKQIRDGAPAPMVIQ